MLYNVNMKPIKYYNSDIFPKLLIVVTAIATALGFFIKLVIEKGRVNEFLISTPILLGTYYVMCKCFTGIDVWGWALPFLIYAAYWIWLFSHEKITCINFKSEWSNKNWWWRLTGWEFEEEVAKVFRLNGYTATVTPKTGDGGADLILYKDDKKYAVQCKHWRSEVPVSCMRELKGVQEDLEADKLIMVASSGVTSDAKEYLSNKPYYKILVLEDIIRMALRPEG